VIPLVAVVSLRHQESRTFRLWIPLPLIGLLLLPAAALLSPLLLALCLICRVNPLRVASVLWQIFQALRDTGFEVNERSAAVSVCVL
jgi:hypothetical protein